MRTIRYSVWNKTTNERKFSSVNLSRVQEVLKDLEKGSPAATFEIRYKWMSI